MSIDKMSQKTLSQKESVREIPQMSLMRAIATMTALYSTFLLSGDQQKNIVPPQRPSISDDVHSAPPKPQAPPPPESREKSNERERIQKFATELTQPTSERPKLFSPESNWKERCEEASNILQNNTNELIDIVMFLSRHLAMIDDPTLRAAVESTLKKHLGVSIPGKPGDEENARKGLKTAADWIRGCSGLAPRFVFSNTSKFEGQYARNLAEILHAILKAAEHDQDGAATIKKLSKILATAR